MGADGGVCWVSLFKGTHENYSRVLELLQPFWQFLSQDGGAYWAEEGHAEWFAANSHIGAPSELVGLYGTDRCDSFTLNDLRDLCTVDDSPSYMGDLYALTFDELDLECRTSPFPVSGNHHEHPLRRLWYEHFHYWSREETLAALGPLANMLIVDWANEMCSLVRVNHVASEETWT